MSRPDPNDLLARMRAQARAYPADTFACTDDTGAWREDLASPRDRIGMELWWALHGAEKAGRCEAALGPALARLTVDDARWEAARAAAGVAPDAPGHVVAAGALVALLEHAGRQHASAIHAPAWDRRAQEVREAAASWCARSLEVRGETFARLVEACAAGDGLFASLARLTSEAETARLLLRTCLGATGDDPVLPVLDPADGFALGTVTARPHALVHLCAELVRDRAAVPTGLPRQAAALLGALRDPRSCRALRAALTQADVRHVNLRTGLVFALGSLVRPEALAPLATLLEGADRHIWERREAVWALGRLAGAALPAAGTLTALRDDPDRLLRLALAWALGRIGRQQRQQRGGVDARILTALLHLLVAEDTELFEEATFAIRDLGLTELLHTLYLGSVATVPILALKPCQTGLQELSETLHYLLARKRPVVMAVTGDSGTGKTYLCRCLAEGFGDVRRDEILYLMRDRYADLNVFNRMLGLDFLRGRIDPQYYEGLARTDVHEDPDLYFDRFLAEHQHRRLILLDGWRDEAHFDHVVRRFYERGRLDLLVRLRATHSTKRLNLEEREGVLERVLTGLTCTEDPRLERTRFFREGRVILYDFDNSVPSRLDAAQIGELFARRRVAAWGDYIRVGRFGGPAHPFVRAERPLQWRPAGDRTRSGPTPAMQRHAVTPDESAITRTLNEDPRAAPNLLTTIRTPSTRPRRIAFLEPGRLALGGWEGDVGVLTGLNDSVLCTPCHTEAVEEIVVVGDCLVSADAAGGLRRTCLLERWVEEPAVPLPGVCALASDLAERFATGHEDGSLRLWDMASGRVSLVEGEGVPVRALAFGRGAILWACTADGVLLRWETATGRIECAPTGLERPRALTSLPEGGVAFGCASYNGEGAVLARSDPAGRTLRVIRLEGAGEVAALHAYFDGRLFAGLRGGRSGTLLVFDPDVGSGEAHLLAGHRLETRDCTTMGPRLLTCGSEASGTEALRIWGAEAYVRAELDKLMLMPDAAHRPPYYRTLV